MSTTNALKRAALSALKCAGVFALITRSKWRKQRLLILGYHGISLEDEHCWDPSLYMSASQFEHRLSLLRKHRCSVLPLREAICRLYLNDLPDRSVVLTFDDGSYDYYKQAYPLLTKYGFPSTIYLSTYYSRRNGPVFDTTCSYMLWKGRGTAVDAGELLGTPLTLDLRTAAGRQQALQEIRHSIKPRKLSQEEESRFLADLATLLKFDYRTFREKRILHLLNEREIAELAGAGVEIQLHTHRHRAPMDRALFKREIEDNRQSIASMCGHAATHFCYPSNFHKSDFLPWLAELRVFSAMTCEPGLATRRSNSLLLPRVIDSANLSQIEFESWIAGVSSLFPHRAAPMHSGVYTAPAGAAAAAAQAIAGGSGTLLPPNDDQILAGANNGD